MINQYLQVNVHQIRELVLSNIKKASKCDELYTTSPFYFCIKINEQIESCGLDPSYRSQTRLR